MKFECPRCKTVLFCRGSRAAHLQLVTVKCTDCGFPIDLEGTDVAPARQLPPKAMRCAICSAGNRLRLFDVFCTGKPPLGRHP